MRKRRYSLSSWRMDFGNRWMASGGQELGGVSPITDRGSLYANH
jgi:hypothetical protein